MRGMFDGCGNEVLNDDRHLCCGNWTMALLTPIAKSLPYQPAETPIASPKADNGPIQPVG